MALDIVSLAIGISAHRRISDLSSDVRAIDYRVNEGELSADALRRDIEKLYLVVEALWAIVRETSGLEDDDLRKLMHEVDMLDGKRDGRNANNTAIVRCEKCGRTVFKGLTACSYCGEPISGNGAFRHSGQ